MNTQIQNYSDFKAAIDGDSSIDWIWQNRARCMKNGVENVYPWMRHDGQSIREAWKLFRQLYVESNK
jgi:hypothetical protein